MHKKLTALFITAGALAFFLLAPIYSRAGTAGEGLEAAVLLAQQAVQPKTDIKQEPAKPQPSPSPTPAQTKPVPSNPAQTQAQPPAAQPVLPKPEQPKPQPRLFLPAASQPGANPQPAQPPAHPVTQPVQTAAPFAPARGEVSFNFDDADVYSVIQTIFGDVLRVNYVIDPAVKGRVTFRSVEPVAKKDVLPLMEVILRLNGIGIVEEGTLYRIIPIADISKEPAPVEVGRDPDKVKITGKALVQVVEIKYMQSSEMVRLLTPFLSKNAVIVDVPNSNYIVIVDTDSNVRRLLQMVNLFDNEQLKAVTPRVYVYPVQNGKAKDVANVLQQIFLGAKAKAAPTTPVTPGKRTLPGQPAAGPQQAQIFTSEGGGTNSLVSDITKIIPDDVTNSLIIMATPDDYKTIADAIARIDTVPRQVMIEGLIVDVKLTNNLSFGLSWQMNTDLKISGIRPFTNNVDLTGNGTNSSNAGLNTGDLASLPNTGFTFVGYDPTGNVRAVLTALEDRSKAKVVAAPHILVADNREASIQVGQQIPLATSQTNTPINSGTAVVNTTTSTIEYKDIGIILKVKPQVNDSGLVALELSQEISSLGTPVSVGGLSEVSINKTQATSNLVARDGETIVIGGLIREDTSHDRTGLPFLSRIPIIGALFGNTTDDTTRDELIILLTPHVIRSAQEAQSTTSDYLKKYKANTQLEVEKLIKQGGKKEDTKGENKKEQAPGNFPAVSP
jgi:type II secretory pathway component GspD/PulD (secretin)